MSIFAKHVCARKLSQTGCARCGELGILEGTTVRVREGWRRVDALNHSDRLRVFSGGHRQAAQIQSENIWLDPFDCPAVVRPLRVPQGAIGNGSSLLLQQDMRVIFGNEAVDGAFGGAHVSIRAGDLIGFRNIALERTPPKKTRLFRISFDGEEAIKVAGGIWLLCPQTHENLNHLIDGAWDACKIGRHPVRHLTADEADVFLALQEAADAKALAHA
ncbi:MAG: Hint domain-containing protein [Paracoccaceae bacterium]|nr:Hint domain-containing protein [Paracoccaceae bacterium]